MKNLIFLDIDGVLNSSDAFKNKRCPYVKEYDYKKFDPNSKYWINKLIEDTTSDIVISSTWRSDGLEKMQQIWELEEMSGEVIGITPHLYTERYGSVPRGCEIESYLKTKGFYHVNYDEKIQEEICESSGISNYIIIDDDSDFLLTQCPHFVHTLNDYGFTVPYYVVAKEILNQSMTETRKDYRKYLNY